VRVRLYGRDLRDVGLVLQPWAARPSRLWRDLAPEGDDVSPWCVVLAPPFLSVVDTRGHAFRRSADFRLPDAIDARSFPAFWSVCRAETIGTTAGDRLVLDAATFQDRVREDLQGGVLRALTALAPVLGQRSGADTGRFSEALTLVYRILFLLFAEARALAAVRHPRYRATYSVTALCQNAAAGAGAPIGLWEGLAAVTRLSRSGCDTGDLIARPFNGQLFARSAAPSLERDSVTRPTRRSKRRDAALAQALVALATRPGHAGREAIAYADLGVEQLGAVYERVLDLDPDDVLTAVRSSEAQLRSGRAHSQKRKESGTFYTPQSLAEFVVRRTLAPLVRDASTDDILALRVVDPAMGSGAFLVAACRFLAQAYEHALVDEGRCADTDLDGDARANVRRLVASRCLSGVDANPVAVQLARLSMWLTTLAKDKPLSFLDHQLRVGDSLVGASPDDLWRSTPAGRRRVPGETPLFDVVGLDAAIRGVARPLRRLREGLDNTIDDVRARERLWSEIAGERSSLAPWRAACDLWCARWFWEGPPAAPSDQELRATLDALLRRDRALDATRVREWLASSRAVARRRGFFHWPLEFADLFYAEDGEPRSAAGFHAVIGNPPWEMIRGGDVTRRSLVTFCRGSGLYPSCDRGHMNLYQPFLERSLSLARPGGRVGLVLPWSLAADEGAMPLRRRLLERGRVDTLVGLDNASGLFPIHRGLRFLVLAASPGLAPGRIHARFGVRTASEIDALPSLPEPGDRSTFPIRLDLAAIRAAGGAALRIPDVKSTDDLDWLAGLSRRFPPLGDERGWRGRFGRELNATEDKEHFGTDGIPVIDGKHISPFRVNARAAGRQIPLTVVTRLLPDERFRRARLAYRDAGVGNRLTLIAAIVPAGVVTTHTLFCLRTSLTDEQQTFLCGLFNSSTLNRIVRMLMGSHVTTGLVENLPVPPWTGAPEQQRVAAIATALGATPAPTAVEADALKQELDDLVVRMYV